MRKPKVYVVNNRNFDLSGTQIYGDLIILYPDTPHDVFSTSKHSYHMRKLLKDATSSDYLCGAGNLILTIIAFGILYERFGFVNLLLYDVRTSEYHARVLPRHQLTQNKEE